MSKKFLSLPLALFVECSSDGSARTQALYGNMFWVVLFKVQPKLCTASVNFTNKKSKLLSVSASKSSEWAKISIENLFAH